MKLSFNKILLINSSFLLLFAGLLVAESSLDQDTWVIRMTLPARLKLEKSITNGKFEYTTLRTTIGHGQERDNGSSYEMEVEKVSVGGRSKDGIQGMERIILFNKDVWISSITKERLKDSIIDIVYFYSNDGIIQEEVLTLVDTNKPLKIITDSNRESNGIASSDTLSFSFPSESREFILTDVIAGQFGFQVEYKDFIDSNISLRLSDVTWMEAFNLILYDSGYKWVIDGDKVLVKKGVINLDIRNIDSDNFNFSGLSIIENKKFETKEMLFYNFVNKVADEYKINYILLDPRNVDELDLLTSSFGVLKLFEQLSVNFNYEMKLTRDEILIFSKSKEEYNPKQ